MRVATLHLHADGLHRCPWCGTDPQYVAYHDDEWGRPVRDDRELFELLCLEGAQAGLSWLTVLRRRDGYRRAFDRFDANAIVGYDTQRIEALLADPGIVRHRQKVASVVTNARAFLEMGGGSGEFSRWLWAFVGGQPLRNRPRTMADVPASTPVSDAMSRELKRRGFGFVGSTICYAFMQASGMVDDHLHGCGAPPADAPVRR